MYFRTFSFFVQNFKKTIEIHKKVVYNVPKWWKVVNSGRKWGVSGRPL